MLQVLNQYIIGLNLTPEQKVTKIQNLAFAAPSQCCKNFDTNITFKQVVYQLKLLILRRILNMIIFYLFVSFFFQVLNLEKPEY